MGYREPTAAVKIHRGPKERTKDENQFPSGQYQPALSIDIRGTGRTSAVPRTAFVPPQESLADVPRVPKDGSSSGATGARPRRHCHRVLTSGDPGVHPADDGRLRKDPIDGSRRRRATAGAKSLDWGHSRGTTLARTPAILRHGRPREQSAAADSGAAPEKVVSPATGDPGLMVELPQVVPRSGRCHGDRGGIHGPYSSLGQGKNRVGGPFPPHQLPGSILRDDPR